MTAKISSIRLESSYYTDSKYTGSVAISGDKDSGLSHAHFNLDAEDVETLMQAAYKIVARHKAKLAAAVDNVELPALLGYDESKTIDETPAPPPIDDEIPF